MSTLINLDIPKPLSIVIDNEYKQLLEEFPIKTIETEEENEYYLEVYIKVIKKYKKNPNFQTYLKILKEEIKKFEDKMYPTPKVTGSDLLNYLMEEHSLKNKDLVEKGVGTASAITMIRKGDRDISKDQAKKLSKIFGVNMIIFLE